MHYFLNLCTTWSLLTTVFAGYSTSSTSNVAVYWGQNSYGQGNGSLAQQRLSYYCSNTELNVIPLAFLTVITDPEVNFANANDNCTIISGSKLLYCSEIEADIAQCQSTFGKTILLSIGGSTYTEGGFSSTSTAVAAANNIWSIFGPYSSNSSVPRPFGKSVIDGFDFDFETSVSNMPAFGNQLRSLMDANKASTGKQWLLTAAPQCPYPDVANWPMLAGTVYFDIIWVQFYNNFCGVQSFTAGSSNQNSFNFDTWDNWAKNVSLNRDVKIMLGIPGNTGAGAGYQTGSTLASIISYCKGFSSFAGIMTWDMSQVYANPGFLDAVFSDVDGSPTANFTISNATTMTTITTKPTLIVSTATSPTTLGVGMVSPSNQCGGKDWNGGTVCIAPYTCVYFSESYSQCE